MSLNQKQIIVGVTGGIAAYKSADLVRRLREEGAEVRVVMTENAKRFITALTMQAVSGYPVHDDLFDAQAEAAMGHIELARWADAILVAPASADFIARLNRGEANDLLSTVCLAANAPILLAPAMNQNMWKNTLTQDNVQALKSKFIHILGPGEGSQACGDIGMGRMLEPKELVEKLNAILNTGSLSGKKVVVTAGPTREYIDAVRFISNASTGKMGYAIAEAARRAGAEVILISGPVTIAAPDKVTVINVISADQMKEAVLKNISGCDIFFGVAAVSDYKSKQIEDKKIPKNDVNLKLDLEITPDIISSVSGIEKKPYIVGFAAESDQLIAKAKSKLQKKNMDMIIANQIDRSDVGFASDDNEVTVLWNNQQKHFAKMRKSKLARELIAFIADKITLKNGKA